MLAVSRDDASWLVEVLANSYGVDLVDVARIDAGTATDNYVGSDGPGRRWFVKVYRDPDTLSAERAAIGLARFARAGGTPIPEVYRALDGEWVVEPQGRPALSLWDYVPDATTAERGLRGNQWASVGAVVGGLHRRLATHPAASPTLRPAAGIYDVERARGEYNQLIEECHRRGSRDEFQRWALLAMQERRALLPRVTAILSRLPPLTTQILHGDLAAPNLLLRGDDVAAVVDFQPPSSRYVAWEIARVACDPRTIALGDQWIEGLSELLQSYRREHPAVQIQDLTSVIAAGCVYTMCSTYPLVETLTATTCADTALREYARVRHDAAIRMLEALDQGPRMLMPSS